MRYSTKLSDATHILLFIHVFADGDLSSNAIAASVQTNPVVIRSLMSDLANANLIQTNRGKAAPTLTRSLADISLLDVYQAVEKTSLLHVDEKTNLGCPVGKNIQGALTNAYLKVQRAAENEMAQISLADILADFRF